MSEKNKKKPVAVEATTDETKVTPDRVEVEVEVAEVPERATVPEDSIVTPEGEAGPNEDGKVNGAIAAATGAPTIERAW